MNTQDPRAYYSELGLSAGASAAEIRDAYHRMAMQWHPDRNRDPAATGRFQRIAEAYRVLSDPKARAQYDSTPGMPPPGQSDNNHIDPIICSKCKDIVAQPRYVVFRYVVSLLLTTIRTPVQGVFCSKCAGREGLKATAISAVAGWWGIPWGPILTVVEGLKNAFGGERPQGAEQRLLWYNAIAFLNRGNFSIAHGLARRVQSLENNELSTYAGDLVSELYRRGVPRDSPPLKNPWKLRLSAVAPHLAMLGALPALAIWLLANAPGTAGASASTFVSAGSGPSSAIAPESQPAAAADTSSACASPPFNGQILSGVAPASDPGHALQIQNGSEGPVIVKVRNAESGLLAFSFFVGQGQSATINGIPDGTYRIQYAIGTNLRSDCTSLTGIRSVDEFPQPETLTTTYTATQVETNTLSYTLYTVPGGNVQPHSIGAADFNSP